MWDMQFRDDLNKHTDVLLSHYNDTKEKYARIWNYYSEHMPSCVQECCDAAQGYSRAPFRDGPQGIYWIGKKPEVFFVGRDHYGWYGDATWPADIDTICFSPLRFSFYTVESMASYWAVIKELIEAVFDDTALDWNNKLERVAFSNACKCLSDNSTYQWRLHANCLRHRFVQKEIVTVNAKVNVLFTKKYQLIDKLFGSQATVIFDQEEFSVRKIGNQTIIECAHPGRQPIEWRNKLKALLKEARQ